MKVHYHVAMAAALSVCSAAFAADDAEALFIKGKCNACHKPDKKTIGPTLKELTAKYAGNKEAQAALEKKVRVGGAGVWGAVPMPRTPVAITDEEIHTIVTWMLSHK